MRHPSRPCPVCGGSAREALFEQQFAMIEGVSILDGYTVVVCAGCGATFADGLPAQAAFDAYYRESSKYVYSQRGGAESAADAARLSISARAIACHTPGIAASILDVGCASGRLLAELRGLGFSKLLGIDPSPDCAATARRLYGVEAQALTLRELAGRREAFDMVVLIGVLEHLVALREALDDLRGVTRAGSRVYIEVPDVEGFADLPNAPFQEFSVEHVNYFSLASLTRTLAGAGFRVTWHERGTPVQAGTTRVSNLALIAERTGEHSEADDLRPDEGSRRAVVRYVEQSRVAERELLAGVDKLAESKAPFVLWGAGTLALRLLAVSRLREAPIAAIVDSNIRYHGRRILGFSVCAPLESAELKLRYVVASAGFYQEISDQIRGISGAESTITGLHAIT